MSIKNYLQDRHCPEATRAHSVSGVGGGRLSGPEETDQILSSV